MTDIVKSTRLTLRRHCVEFPDERTSNPERANMAQLREWLEARGLVHYADTLLA